VPNEVAVRVPQTRGYRYVVASNRVLLVGTSRIVVGVFADANARRAKDAGRLRIHQVRLKPALRLFARGCDRSAYDEGDSKFGLPMQIGPQTKFGMCVLRRAHGKPL